MGKKLLLSCLVMAFYLVAGAGLARAGNPAPLYHAPVHLGGEAKYPAKKKVIQAETQPKADEKSGSIKTTEAASDTNQTPKTTDAAGTPTETGTAKAVDVSKTTDAAVVSGSGETIPPDPEASAEDKKDDYDF
ncbi:MAG: hypothetical protein HQM16_05255 [Deltaproteobacteria bacterium]|nr:hypothetical protein [Deltaproteobacteria bacterium]